MLIPPDGAPDIVRKHVQRSGNVATDQARTLVQALFADRPELASIEIELAARSTVTLAEEAGKHGVAKRASPTLAERVRDLIASAGTVLPFDDAAAEHYGALRARLERDGRRLAEPDLRIASISLARDLTLVTANTRQFARVSGLRVENWLTA